MSGKKKNNVGYPENKDEITWPKEDIKKLLDSISEHIPSDDRLSYKLRESKLPWTEIAFGKYTATECQRTWELILQRVRKYRLLDEVLGDARIWLTRPWTNYYAKKSNQHPDKPKRPLTPLNIFIKEKSYIRKQHPGKSLGEITKIFNNLFKELPAEEKQKYVQASNLLKEEYERKKTLFLLKNPSEASSKQLRKIKNANTHVTGFTLYLSEHIKLSDDNAKPSKEDVAIYEQKWEELDESEKLEWIQRASEEKKTIKSRFDTVVAKASPIKKKKAPKKPPASIFYLFCKKTLSSGIIENLSKNDQKKELSILWKQAGADVREALAAELQKEQEKYIEEYNMYLKSEMNNGNGSTMKIEEEKSMNISNSHKFGSEESIDETKNAVDSIDAPSFDLKIAREDVSVLSDSAKNTRPQNDESLVKKSKNKRKKNPNISTDTIEGDNEFSLSNIDISRIPTEDETSVAPKKMKISEDLSSSKRSKKKKENDTIDYSALEPVHPPKEPIMLFKKEMKKKKMKFSSEEELNDAWNQLPPSDRKAYKKKVKQLKREYLVEYKNFLSTLPMEELIKYTNSNEIDE